MKRAPFVRAMPKRDRAAYMAELMRKLRLRAEREGRCNRCLSRPSRIDSYYCEQCSTKQKASVKRRRRNARIRDLIGSE